MASKSHGHSTSFLGNLGNRIKNAWNEQTSWDKKQWNYSKNHSILGILSNPLGVVGDIAANSGKIKKYFSGLGNATKKGGLSGATTYITQQGIKEGKHLLQVGGHTVNTVFQKVDSAVAGVVAKCIAALFVSSALGKWLQSHSVAAIVFGLMGTGGSQNSDATLSQIVSSNPYQLIFTKDTMPTFMSAISGLQGIFNTIAIFIFMVAIYMAAIKPSESSILNNPEKMQEAYDRAIKIFCSFMILAFLPQIVEILLQIDGAILLALQDFMLSVTVGSGKSATSMWSLALAMGGTMSGMTKQLQNPSGFIFTFLFFIINVLTAIMTYAYYLWRQASFVILYLLAYIQIPSLALAKEHSGFEKWFRAMFGTIFIQDVQGLVVVLMAIFFKSAYAQLNFSFDKILQNMGVMLMMGVVLAMFMPLSQVIANQLDLDTSMADALNNEASGIARNIGRTAWNLEKLPFKAAGSLAKVGLSAAAAAATDGASAAVMAGAGAAASDHEKNKNDPNNGKNTIADFMSNARQQNRVKGATKQAAKEAKTKMGAGLRSVMGDLAEFAMYDPRDRRNPDPGRQIKNNMERRNQAEANGLRNIQGTQAGGVISDKGAGRFKNFKDLGFMRLKDMKQKAINKYKSNSPSGTNIKSSTTDGSAKRSTYNPEVNGNKSKTEAYDQMKKDEAFKAPTGDFMDMNKMRNWANTVSNSPFFDMYKPDPIANATPMTQKAFQAKAQEMQKDNPNVSASEVESAFKKEASSPRAISRAMDDAIKETTNGEWTWGYAPVGPTMAQFGRNLKDLGYSDEAVDHIMHATGFSAPRSDGDIDRNANPNKFGPGIPPNIEPGSYSPEDGFGGPNRSANGSTFDMGNLGHRINRQSLYSDPGPLGSEGMSTHVTPSYLADNLARDESGNYAADALMAHVNNGSSYITARMQDGTQKIVSGIGPGNASMTPFESFTMPLTYSPNSANGAIIRAASDQGIMTDRTGSHPITGANPYVNKAIDAFNQGRGYGNMSTVIPAANGLVDNSQYTMEHLMAESPNLSKFELNGDRSMSYITAWDTRVNGGEGGRVRLSMPLSGVSKLNQGVTFNVPLSYQNGKLNASSLFTFGRGSNATNADFKNLSDWMNGMTLDRYIRPTAFNDANYQKNHQGNVSLNNESFYGS